MDNRPHNYLEVIPELDEDENDQLPPMAQPQNNLPVDAAAQDHDPLVPPDVGVQPINLQQQNLHVATAPHKPDAFDGNSTHTAAWLRNIR